MDLLEHLKTSTLNFSFAIIHKILVLLESHLNCFKDNIQGLKKKT